MKVYITPPLFPSEFNAEESIYEIFENAGLTMGRIISGSKSGYYDKNPDHKVVFNANVITESRGKIFYGDLDLTLDTDKLKEVAEILKEPLYVLREMDARFENEDQSFEFYKERAVVKIDI
jgi:hypothetical protein